MGKGLLATVKISLVMAIIVLAIISTLYVLDVIENEALREIFMKLMSVLGIWTAASMLLLTIAYLGSQNRNKKTEN
jgi:hypothetical protein